MVSLSRSEIARQVGFDAGDAIANLDEQGKPVLCHREEVPATIGLRSDPLDEPSILEIPDQGDDRLRGRAEPSGHVLLDEDFALKNRLQYPELDRRDVEAGRGCGKQLDRVEIAASELVADEIDKPTHFPFLGRRRDWILTASRHDSYP